jgi:ribosome-associated translation inhibitor RaiA
VDGDKAIAANHIEEADLLNEVALIKQQLTKYRRSFKTMYEALDAVIADLEKQRKTKRQRSTC